MVGWRPEGLGALQRVLDYKGGLTLCWEAGRLLLSGGHIEQAVDGLLFPQREDVIEDLVSR